MINNIRIAGEATYPPAGAELIGLRSINYIFGHNGCGKTTISRAIDDPEARPGYSVTWENGRAIETRVYNRDFCEANFGEQMRGIFTLGEDSTKAVAEIAELQAEILKLDRELDTLKFTLEGANGYGGKRKDLADARARLEEACWESQKQHPHFEQAFTGFRGKKRDFCSKILDEAGTNEAPLAELETLKTRAATVFQPAAPALQRILDLDFAGLGTVETDPILERRIIGCDNAVVAGLIGRLGNIDWVRRGIPYLESAEGRCPFCQQAAPADLAAELNGFFDEQYEADLAQITDLLARYRFASSAITDRIEAIVGSGHRFVNVEVLLARQAAFCAIVERNLARLTAKRIEPSTVVVLELTDEASRQVADVIERANAAIATHNATMADLQAAKRSLTAQIWRYLVEERKTDLVTHASTNDSIERAIRGLEGAIGKKREERGRKRARLEELEATTTSVKPTVDGINRILSMYSFHGFKLAVAGERNEMYRLVREDGSDAAKSLSEGERSFVTFLYFYHWLAGSTSSSGTTGDKVIVFDDPVSSLDADVLFIVSALIRKMIGDLCDGTGPIRQVFVLTHNIYFHKEVTFDRKRGAGCRAHETFWIVRKRGNVSSVECYDHNPVRTSYELLWEEVRNPERRTLTVQNTLRRIVENYLVVLGGLDQDDIMAKFEGQEAMICASLFSWINDGSHGANDDLYLTADQSAVEGFLHVFEQVFIRTGHGAHYRMMMRTGDSVPVPVPVPRSGDRSREALTGGAAGRPTVVGTVTGQI